MTLDGNGDLVVTETGAGQVQVISPQGEVKLTVGSLGKKPGQLSGPEATAVDEAGNFYVADQFSNFISVFDATGTFVGSIGTEGAADRQFVNGIGVVAYGGKGSLYTLDYPYESGGRLQKFKVTVTHRAPGSTPDATPSA